MKNTILLLLLVLSLSLAACAAKPAAPTAAEPSPSAALREATQSAPETTYPVAESVLSSAYPIKLPEGVPLSSLSAPAEALPPQEGFASISGLLYAYDISQILVNTDFWLFPAVTVGDQKVPPPIITNGDPAEGDIYGRTDANGAFYLDKVPAGDYYLLINYPDHTVFGQSSPTPDAYLLITVAAGDRTAYGVIYTVR
ncbi:MAG: hypothetical protein GYA40_02850 [Chloroflexi bacterium]|nr:hypothetical protein [Chloroflexota bacterium]